MRDTLRGTDEVRDALDRMWPVLTPAQLLHDLFGSKALLKSAGRGVLDDHQALLLFRERSESVADVRWTPSDVALLDDARDVLGPKLGKNGKVDEYDEIRTYGHIVIDEVQDLTPMQLKMATRRSLSGSMTIVGDIAQATGPLAPDGMGRRARLPARPQAGAGDRPVGRLPHPAADHGARQPGDGRTPRRRCVRRGSVRVGDAAPAIVAAPSPGQLATTVADEVRSMIDALPNGSLGVVAPDQLIAELSGALTDAGIKHGTATRTGLDAGVTLVPVSVVKGLELDGVVVVEPTQIVTDLVQGMRSLYVALTRSTQRLTVVHSIPLPEPLR